MDKIDKIVRSMLWFWTGLCTGWFIFGNDSFSKILGCLIIGMTAIVACGWGTTLIMREIDEHKRQSKNNT